MSDNTMKLVKRGPNYSIVMDVQSPDLGYHGTGCKVLRTRSLADAELVMEACNNGASKDYSWQWADFRSIKYAVVNNNQLPWLLQHFIQPETNEFGPVSP